MSLCIKNAIGTPQLRWRDTHQSRRFFIIDSNRARPQAGKNSVLATAELARFLRVSLPSNFVESKYAFLDASFRIGPSIPMNHCLVARKIIGVLCLQP